MTVKIVTDSTSYIPKKYVDKYDIKVVSLNVFMDGISKREVDIDNKSFYKEMEILDGIPKSSQPTPEDMISTFEGILKEGDSVVGIFLSSKMSGTYSNANMIKNMLLEDYPNGEIHIIDSKTNCMQMGFVAIEAAKVAHENKTIDEVISTAEQVIESSKFLFTPETLEYLKKGGRIGKASALVGNLLQIKPILTVTDGETCVYKKVRTRKKAIEDIVESVFEDINTNGLGDIIVHHINCEEDGLKLAKVLESKINRTVDVQPIGPVIGIHVGPGSVGIAYYTKNK